VILGSKQLKGGMKPESLRESWRFFRKK